MRVKHDWGLAEIVTLYRQPLNDLLHRAHSVHRRCFDPNRVQLSTLLNIKSGGCPEDCAYCPQSVRYKTGVDNEALMSREQVLAEARRAKASGASRFCMGAAWRGPKDRDIDRVAEMISGVRDLGLETCVTLGMLKPGQPERLKRAGLDYYNHNLDTSESFYSGIISTRTYRERLDTLQRVRDAGINVCCGGIIGMGEKVEDRAALLQTLACLPRHPESVPINTLVKVAGTPLAGQEDTDPIELVRTVACARILMPNAYVRLSAGTNRNERLNPGAVFLCRRQFRLLRRQAADDRQPAIFQGSGPVRTVGVERHRGKRQRGSARRAEFLMSRPLPADPHSLADGLDRIRAAGRFRTRRTITSAQGPLVRSGGHTYINFSSNDYLGLANDGRLVQALQAGAARYGVGSGASQLVCGRSRAHADLEETVAQRLGRSRALLFSSGYLANLAVITSFAARRKDVVVMDRENHASLIDGALLARAGLRRYAHLDTAELEKLCGRGCTLVATDGVFSMDGSVAPLPGIAATCSQRGVLLAVDDAHGFGVLGKTGGGAVEHFSLNQAQVPVLMGTFAKACGVMGGFRGRAGRDH